MIALMKTVQRNWTNKTFFVILHTSIARHLFSVSLLSFFCLSRAFSLSLFLSGVYSVAWTLMVLFCLFFRSLLVRPCFLLLLVAACDLQWVTNTCMNTKRRYKFTFLFLLSLFLFLSSLPTSLAFPSVQWEWVQICRQRAHFASAYGVCRCARKCIFCSFLFTFFLHL